MHPNAFAVFALIAGLIVGAAAHADPLSAARPGDPVSASDRRGTFWISSNATTHLNADLGPAPLQGIRGPRVSPDGSRIVFAALGDLWMVDLDQKLLAQGKPPKGRHLIKDEPLDFDPAWSSDGTQLAYVSDRSGMPEIWLRDMKTAKERQLTTSNEAIASPSWSPDGERIAFFKIPNAGDPGLKSLNVVAVFTGDVVQLRSDVRTAGPVSWSPDGKTLALKVRVQAAAPPHDSAGRILLISLAGAPDRVVAPESGLSPRLTRGEGPVWSPDGTKIAYVDEGILSVVPVVPRGAHAGEIAGPAHTLTSEFADSPSWTGDSKAIVYLATDRLKRLTLDGDVADVQPNLTWLRDIPQGRTVVWAGRLWDGGSAGYRENVDIVIDGDVITAIEPHIQRDKQVHVVNASKRTVIPGLIDTRARMASSFGERLGRLWLSFGITSVREWGEDPYSALERRESWASGRRPGPRDFFVKAPDDVGMARGGDFLRRELERAQRLEYDLAASDENVFVHASGTAAARPMTFGLGSDAAQIAAEPGMTMMPNLALGGGFVVKALRDPAVLANTQIAALYTDDERAALKTFVNQARPRLADLQRNLTAGQLAERDLVARGGQIVLGSGAPSVPYGLGFLVECELAQDGGLSPLQVLQAATSGAAAALGVDKQLGTVMAGKLADLAIVDGDPLSRISDLANISGVVADGRYYISDELLQH